MVKKDMIISMINEIADIGEKKKVAISEYKYDEAAELRD